MEMPYILKLCFLNLEVLLLLLLFFSQSKSVEKSVMMVDFCGTFRCLLLMHNELESSWCDFSMPVAHMAELSDFFQTAQ